MIKGLSMFRRDAQRPPPLTFGDGTAPTRSKCTFTYQWKGTTCWVPDAAPSATLIDPGP
jgi:hypothetical protein